MMVKGGWGGVGELVAIICTYSKKDVGDEALNTV